VFLRIEEGLKCGRNGGTKKGGKGKRGKKEKRGGVFDFTYRAPRERRKKERGGGGRKKKEGREGRVPFSF